MRSSQLNGDTRIDAEYFSKSNVCLHTILLRYGVLSIGDIAFVTDGIHTSIDYDQNGYINLISATSPRENVFDLSRNVFISEKAHSNNPRTALRKNDVIISTVGTIGNCAVVDNTILPANSDRHVGIIRLQKDYSPYVLSTFMLSKYGRMQTLRESTGNVQLNLFIYKLKELLVPNFPKNFQLQIEQMVKSAHAKLEESKQLYTAAENQLLEELCLKNWQPKNENMNVKTLSESFLSSGRLDAEYYQSKYDELFTKLSKYQCDRIAYIVKIKKSIEPGSDAYRECGVPFVRVSDVTKFGISEPSIFLDDSDVLKSLKLKKDTILLSKDGSIGIAYKVDENMDCVTSGALLHLSICNKDYNPDYLTLVLNSNIVKLQAERDSNGAIIQHWKPSEIEQVLIPKLSIEIQNEISAKIQRSFALKKESKSLLEQTKTMVESEIEKGV